MQTIYFSTYTFVPDAITKAFSYIKDRFPDVQKVVYDADGKWNYINADGTSPEFNSTINIAVLEAGSDAAGSVGYPVCYSLFTEIVVAECYVDPKVQLIQIAPELWSVRLAGGGVCTPYSTYSTAHDGIAAFTTYLSNTL